LSHLIRSPGARLHLHMKDTTLTGFIGSNTFLIRERLGTQTSFLFFILKECHLVNFFLAGCSQGKLGSGSEEPQ